MMSKAIRSTDKLFRNASGEAVDGKLWYFYNCRFITVYQVERCIYLSLTLLCDALVKNVGFSIEDANKYVKSLGYLNIKEL